MSIRKLALLAATIGLLAAPAFAQSTQDSNTYPDSVPDTPQAGNLAGHQDDFDASGPTGTILEPGPAPDALDMPGYDSDGDPNADLPPGDDAEPLGREPNDQ